MLKTEFENMVDQDVSDDDYEKIETVYMYYPGIEDKSQIADLYNQFGMVIILDMLPRTEKIQSRETRIRKLVAEIEKLKTYTKGE